MPMATSRPAASTRPARGLPSPALLFAVVAAALLGSISVLHGITDPDYFWHLATGELIASSGIPRDDPFSFTRFGAPWIADQWLSELVLYLTTSAWGETPTLAVFGAVAGMSFWGLTAALNRRGVTVAAVVLGALPFLMLAVPYVTARPQVLSWALLATELALLVTVDARRRWPGLLIPPLFVLWANVHGLYVVGLIVGLIYLVATFAGRTPLAHRGRGYAAMIAAASLAACLVTPYGPDGLLYVLNFTDAGDWGFVNLQEWQSPDFHDPLMLPLIVLVVALLVVGGRVGPGWLYAVSVFGLFLALIAVRNAPVAGLLAIPTLAFAAQRILGSTLASRPPPTTQSRGRRIVEVALAGVIAAAAVSIAAVYRPDSEATVAARFPVQAVSALRSSDPDARILAHYGWGGYVLYAVSDFGGKVFVDGRNHLYGDEVLEDYAAIVGADPDWSDLVDRYGVEAILLKPDAPLVGISPAGWCEAYRDSRQVLLLESCR